MNNLDVFYRGLESLNIILDDKQISQFMKYYDMLIEKNKVMNLTAITEFNEVITKHFLDSLSIVKIYDKEKLENEHISIIDVGTGAGFPGIPLKIAFPKLTIVLLDSLNKRVKFLNDVCDELELKDITAIHGRAEEIGRKTEYRQKFDICVSRAVANLSTLAEYCQPFVKVGGYFIPYKAGNVEEELLNATNAIKKLSGVIVDKKDFVLPDSDINRVLIKIEKNKPIAKAYPRKAGMPGKEPLQ